MTTANDQSRRRGSRILVISAGIVLGAGLAVAAKEVLVDRPTLAIRSERSGMDPPVTTVTQGTKLEVLSEQGGFLQVRAPDGKVGWVKATALSARNLSAGNAELVRNADSSGLNTTLAARGNLEEAAQAYARSSGQSTAGVQKMLATRKNLQDHPERLHEFQQTGKVGAGRQ
jgi:hypothetical protein